MKNTTLFVCSLSFLTVLFSINIGADSAVASTQPSQDASTANKKVHQPPQTISSIIWLNSADNSASPRKLTFDHQGSEGQLIYKAEDYVSQNMQDKDIASFCGGSNGTEDNDHKRVSTNNIYMISNFLQITMRQGPFHYQESGRMPGGNTVICSYKADTTTPPVTQ